MSSTVNVLQNLGEGPFVYKEMMISGSSLGILTGARAKPRIISAGLRGFYLGLHNEAWSIQPLVVSGANSYYVQVVPICRDLTDLNGDYLKGTPTIQNNIKGVTFSFQPYPNDYYCNGYEVWAGTVSGTLYKQGTLKGRFNCTFTIGTTWTLVTTGDTLSAQSIGPPAFASTQEVFQLEGTINSHLFLGGGKSYRDGYLQVAKASSAPVLTGGTSATSAFATWAAIANGSFRMKQRWLLEATPVESYVDYTDIDFTGDASMADVASTLQTSFRAAKYPYLISGTPETTIATWAAITDGSFRIFVNGQSVDVTACDFSAVTTMAEVATVIQTAMQTQTLLTSGTCTWDSTALRFKFTTGQTMQADVIVNGSFAADTNWTKGTDWTISAGKAHLNTTTSGRTLTQNVTLTAGRKYRLTFTTSGMSGCDVNNYIYASFDCATATDINLLYVIANGTHYLEMTCTATETVTITFTDLRTTSTIVCDLDDVSVVEINDGKIQMGYLERHSTATGTDISTMLAGRETSDGVFLMRYFKPANLDTVTWSTNHFIFTGAIGTLSTGADMTIISSNGNLNLCYSTACVFDLTQFGQLLKVTGDEDNVYRITGIKTHTVSAGVNRYALIIDTPYAGSDTTSVTFKTVFDGARYQYGFVSAVLYATGTDICTMLDGKSTSATASITQGQTEYRSVIGQSTKWGNWCEGMKLFIADEGNSYIVNECVAEDHLYLDSDYDGDALLGKQTYRLQPYTQQIYPSKLANPFYFSADDIVPLPVDDSDGVCSLSSAGGLIEILMDHHSWVIDGVDITSPRVQEKTDGCPYLNGVILYKDGCAAFTGDDFVYFTGNGSHTLDPDKRVRHLITRINANADVEPFGVYFNDKETELLIWWLAIDSSYTPNVALCCEPSSGNWWVYNHKAMSCAGIIRDANGETHLLTASPADLNLSIPSFTLLHSRDYHADGAATASTYDRQGLVGSVGTSTATAGYLTCKACGAIATFQAVTSGYFTVTIDDTEYLVGPCDFSAQSTLAGCAAIIQTAIRLQTGGSETCVYSTDHFVITSGTTTNRSVVDYLRAGYNVYTDTDISGKTYMNGQEGTATKTYPVSTLVLNLTDLDGNVAVLYTANDGEKGTSVFVCDTNYRNGSYAKVSTNSSTQITITPVPSDLPVAGWRWYLGGIVPSWLKWFDFNSPQHKKKLSGIAITTPQTESTAGNILVLHGMQDLVSTIRTTKTQQLGTGQNPTNTLFLSDKPATQQGIKIIRPSADYDLEIDDITVIHTPIV